MIASQNDHTEVVKCLIEAKASPDLKAKVNCVPILFICISLLHHVFVLTKRFTTFCI